MNAPTMQHKPSRPGPNLTAKTDSPWSTYAKR